MINCRQCEFLIKGNMRHALVKNCCPACGAAILGETHTQRMRLFKQRLLQQEFAQTLNDDLVFDITLFMLLEFSPLNLAKKKDEEEPLEEEEGVLSEEPDLTAADEDYDSIRDVIREEALLESGGLDEDLDEDLKIARLKRLAKETKVRRPGAAVRRLGDD